MLLMAWIFTFLSLIPSIASMLEDDIHYDINWLAELPTMVRPVSLQRVRLSIRLSQPIDHDNQVLFMTKRNEKYSCVLPTLTTTLPVRSTRPFVLVSLSHVQTSANTISLAEVQPFIDEFYAKKPCTYRVRALV
jgi:hypothetical protein